MLLDDNEINERLESPLNLMNRLKALTNPHRPHSMVPALPPKADDIIDDIDKKINNGSIKSKAMGLVSQALDELKVRMPEVQKPRELAAIAEQMSKIINNTEQKQSIDGPAMPQIIIYAPKIVSEDTFNIVELNES